MLTANSHDHNFVEQTFEGDTQVTENAGDTDTIRRGGKADLSVQINVGSNFKVTK